jgi:hypothetical protein
LVAATLVMAALCVLGAAFGVVRDGAPVAIGFRLLTSWRLSVAARLIRRPRPDSPRVVALAALGSMLAHTVLLLASVAATWCGGSFAIWAEGVRRCSVAESIALPLSLVGLAHAAWLWAHAQACSHRASFSRTGIAAKA